MKADHLHMNRALIVLLIGLGLSLIGTLTTTDAISLRATFQSVPLLSTLVFAARLGMGTPMAHTLEPACATIGLAVMLLALRVRSSAPSRIRTGDLSLERAAS
jgi:hypothetical protein